MRTTVLGLSLLLASCDIEMVEHARVTLAVKGVTGNVQAAPAGAPRGALRVAALQPHEIAGMSFTPESVFVPISRITLEGYVYEVVDGVKSRAASPSSQEIYRCPGAAPQDCLVEISSPAALEALSAKLRNISVVEGDYERISIVNGFGEGDVFNKGAARAKGSFALNGVTYYTSATGPVTDAAAYDYLELTLSKRDWSFPIQANGSLTLTADKSVTVSLFANYDALLYGLQISEIAYEKNGCPSNAALSMSICGTEPSIVGFIGQTVPSLEHYAMHFSGSGWYDRMTGLMVLVLDGNGDVIGIMPKQFYDGAVGAKSPNFFGAVESFAVNADGRIDMTKGTAGDPGFFTINGFARKDHEGAVVLEAQDQGKYAAVKR